jgi:hypothetical protein
MEDLLQFLQIYEIWIYTLLGAVALIYIRKLIMAWHEWRTAVFGLERESAIRRFSSALTIVGLLGIILFAQFFVISFVAPAYPKSSILQTPTISLLSTPTGVFTISETDTLAEEVSEGPSSNDVGEGCVSGQLEWTFPIPGDEIGGSIELEGTVNIPDLGFYKYEFNQPGSDTWVTIAAGNEKKISQPLGGVWNTSQLIPGDYMLRLVVTDSQNEELLPCEIMVRVISE